MSYMILFPSTSFQSVVAPSELKLKGCATDTTVASMT